MENITHDVRGLAARGLPGNEGHDLHSPLEGWRPPLEAAFPCQSPGRHLRGGTPHSGAQGRGTHQRPGPGGPEPPDLHASGGRRPGTNAAAYRDPFVVKRFRWVSWRSISGGFPDWRGAGAVACGLSGHGRCCAVAWRPHPGCFFAGPVSGRAARRQGRSSGGALHLDSGPPGLGNPQLRGSSRTASRPLCWIRGR